MSNLALVSQNKTVVPGCSTHLFLRQPRTLITPPASLRVFSSLGSNRDPNGSLLIETTATSSSSLETSAADIVPKSTVSGGVQDVYGEDAATEDMPITPWSLSVASGYTLLRDPHHNKGLAFSHRERDAHYLRGLLPPTVISQDLQVSRLVRFHLLFLYTTANLDFDPFTARFVYRLKK